MIADDRFWIEFELSDGEVAEQLWRGAPGTDAPAWCARVATLVRTARGPGTREELEHETEIVARMRSAALEGGSGATIPAVEAPPPQPAPAEPPPRHLRLVPPQEIPGGRVVRRVVAVKAAALSTAVVLGVTAAAAATGIVATVVVPAISDHDEPAPERKSSTATSAQDRSDGRRDDRGGPVADDASEQDPSLSTCVVDAGCVDPVDVAETAPSADTPSGTDTATSSTATTTTTSTTSTTTLETSTTTVDDPRAPSATVPVLPPSADRGGKRK